MDKKNKDNKLIIFDLDGTILDTIEDITNAMNKALNEFGFNVNYTQKEVMNFVGSGVVVMTQRALVKFNLDSNDEMVNTVKNKYNEIYTKSCDICTKPFDGMIDVLNVLKQKGYYLVVYSNKPDNDAKKVVEHYFGNNIFSLVMGKMDNVPIKPNPMGLNLILNRFSFIKHENIYYVGDSNTDMETGNNANLKVIAVTYGYRDIKVLEKYHPYAMVNSPNELINIIK